MKQHIVDQCFAAGRRCGHNDMTIRPQAVHGLGLVAVKPVDTHRPG